MKISDVKDEIQKYKNAKGEWDVTFNLYEDRVRIETVSNLTMEHYQAQMTLQNIKQDRNFQFFFTNVVQLFKFLQTSFADLIISNGQIKMEVQFPLGKIKKKIQLKIPTTRKEIDQFSLRNIKLRKMQEEIDQMRKDALILRQKLDENIEEQTKIVEIMAKFDKILAEKDQVINSIFQQIKELRQWKQQKEKNIYANQKNQFVPDTVNPHNSKFIQIGNRYKKKCPINSWDILMCKNQIEKNTVSKYTLRQIKAGLGGSFMYGIGTASLRGVTRAQDNKQYIGYYQNTGNVYDRAQSRKGGSKIKDGDVITIQIDTINWLISWTIQGEMEAQVAISPDLRTKPLYLAIIIFNDESEIQFI